MESMTESQLVQADVVNVSADVYQAGHHGSKTSSSSAFLDEVDPDITIVSSALDSQYGHPHQETIERFESHSIETYWTATHGDTVVKTNGSDIWVETENEATTGPSQLPLSTAAIKTSVMASDLPQAFGGRQLSGMPS
jgi:competence protein ComEC